MAEADSFFLRRFSLGIIRRWVARLLVFVAFGVITEHGVAGPEGAQLEAGALWRGHVELLLRKRCQKCHGALRKKAGLDLRTPEAILRGGETGSALVPGQPEESLLWRLVQPGADPHMPPKGEGLTDGEIGFVAEWIEAMGEGAPTAPKSVETDAGAGLWESPPEGLRPELVIDLFVEQKWQAEGIEPANLCDDQTYVRRVYLDLAGRIPTSAEAKDFEEGIDSRKRRRLVEELIAGPEFSRHMAEIFNVVLLGREDGKRRRRSDREANDWYKYLRWAFATNRPWDRMARDLLVARPESGDTRGSVWYLYENRDDHEAIAKAAAPVFFGRRIHCAQCHDHPVAPEIEQRHYWGLVAFFKRSFNVDGSGGAGIAESAVGGDLQFSNLRGDSSAALPVFFDGRAAPAPPGDGRVADGPENYRQPPPAEYFQAKTGGKDRKKRSKRKVAMRMDTPSVPLFSRREALADIGVDDNPDFARTFVNRMWAWFFGRGIVHPVDQMDSVHPPSHPELLDWLGRDFAAHGYDVRRLIRGLTASRAYQLDSRHPGPRRPLPGMFACAGEKPLTGEMLYRSLLVASGREPGAAGGFVGVAEETFREAFTRVFPDVFAERFSPGAQQALFLSNNALMSELTRPFEGSVMVRLLRLDTPEDRVVEAFHAVLGRLPAPEEKQRGLAYLDARGDRLEDGLRHLVWALMTGAEFRLNH